MHITHITKTSLMTAIVILFILTNTCAATPPSSSLDSGTVVVEASGNVPGFTETQLATYLARRMHEETADPWQFSAGKPGRHLHPIGWYGHSKPSASNGRPGPIEDSRRRHIRRFISALR